MRVFALALAALLAMPAAAQRSEPKDEVIVEPDRVVTLKTSAVDFSEVVIEAELTKPSGTYAVARGRTKFRNLIELRGSFRPELARTASRLP